MLNPNSTSLTQWASRKIEVSLNSVELQVYACRALYAQGNYSAWQEIERIDLVHPSGEAKIWSSG